MTCAIVSRTIASATQIEAMSITTLDAHSRNHIPKIPIAINRRARLGPPDTVNHAVTASAAWMRALRWSWAFSSLV